MSFDDTFNDDLTEKIKILATDDDKIKSFGELFTNDSSRQILQLLFNEELTATQISQKTGISLQLVKYHLNKLQDLGVVKISKIEKNSKSQNMKIYSATKFTIVIVPPTLSEKTKESKLLVRSFRHIYKVAGFGIATGISGLLSLSQLSQDKQIPANDVVMSRQFSSIEESAFTNKMEDSFSSDDSTDVTGSPVLTKSESHIESEEIPEMQESGSSSLDVVDTTIGVENGLLFDADLFILFIISTVILGGFTTYYLWKFFKKSKS